MHVLVFLQPLFCGSLKCDNRQDFLTKCCHTVHVLAFLQPLFCGSLRCDNRQDFLGPNVVTQCMFLLFSNHNSVAVLGVTMDRIFWAKCCYTVHVLAFLQPQFCGSLKCDNRQDFLGQMLLHSAYSCFSPTTIMWQS